MPTPRFVPLSEPRDACFVIALARAVTGFALLSCRWLMANLLIGFRPQQTCDSGQAVANLDS